MIFEAPSSFARFIFHTPALFRVSGSSSGLSIRFAQLVSGPLPSSSGHLLCLSSMCIQLWLDVVASHVVVVIRAIAESLVVVVVSVPQNITPLASASPSSPPSDHSRPSLNSSFQTTRFKFRSRLNKPLISANITVIFTKEEDELSSSDNISMTQSQSQNTSEFQGEIAGVVLNDDNMQNEDGFTEAPQPHPASSQDQILACEPARFSGSILNLDIPPEGSVMDAEDNEMVTWIGSPSQANKDATDSPPHD